MVLYGFTEIIFFKNIQSTPILFNIDKVISIYGFDVISPFNFIERPFFRKGAIKIKAEMY